jgi:hypothetical protein
LVPVFLWVLRGVLRGVLGENSNHPKHYKTPIIQNTCLAHLFYKPVYSTQMDKKSIFFDISQVKIQSFYIYFEFTVHPGAWEPELCAPSSRISTSKQNGHILLEWGSLVYRQLCS